MSQTPFESESANANNATPSLQQLQTQIALTNPLPPDTPRSNSLASKQFVTFIDLLSEGEIEGFPSAADYEVGTKDYTNAALKDVFLNGVPVVRQNADPTDLQDEDFNFKDVDFKQRLGTKDQTFIGGFLDSESSINPALEINVGTKVLNDSPVTIQITRQVVDAVRLTLGMPALQSFTNSGINGATLEFQIQISYQTTDSDGIVSNTDFETLITDTVTGRSASKYQRSYRIDLREASYDLAQIRVVKITEDAADPAKLQNELFVSSYTELIYQKLRYPHSALAALRVDSEQLQSIPRRSYKIRGVKVKIPSGVTVDQSNGRIVYPENYIFDGTFAESKAWTSDPAWVLYDILTNTRYGLGLHVSEDSLDVYAFYGASRYSSALVSDNDGGTEPRFSINVLIQNQDEAYTLINELASVMRCMPYWSSGSLAISQDSPKDASYLFTNANVSEEGFQYKGTSIKQRHTVVVVSYFDMISQDIKYEVVEDHDAIAKFGIVQTEIKAFGCNSRSQAKRFGEWLLYTEANESSVISFETGPHAGVALRPGLVVKVADSTKSIIRYGGRTVRTPQIFTSGISGIPKLPNDNLPVNDLVGATISILMPDGTIESRQISLVSQTSDSIYFFHFGQQAFSQEIAANSVYIIQTSTIEPSQWRIISIEEKDQARYFINAVSYNPSKYDFIERGEPLLKYNTTPANLTPAAPGAITVQEFNVEEFGVFVNKLILDWESVQGVNKYFVRYRYEDGQWEEFNVIGPNAEIKNTNAGLYDIQVYSLSAIGSASIDHSQTQFLASGPTTLPETPTGLSLLPVSEEQAILSWDRALRADVLNGGKVLIRHTPANLSVTAWKDSNKIVEAAAGNQTQKIVPLLEGTYSIKFETIGDSPRRTAVAAFIQAQVPSTTFLTVQTINEHSTFLGTKTNMVHDTSVGGYNGLVLDSDSEFDEIANLDLVVDLDTLGDVAGSGEYEFGSQVNLNGKYTVRASRILQSVGYVSTDTLDVVPNIDELILFDGIAGEGVNAKVYVKNSDSNLDWSDLTWQELTKNFVTGRYFRFKLEATSENSDENIIVTELGALVEMVARIETGDRTSTTNSAADSITFDNAFIQAPQIMITVKELATGDFFELTDVTRTGFNIKIKGSGGTRIAKAFTYNAFGYGKQI